VKRYLVLLLVAAAGACAPAPAATLSVAAASDLRYALDELNGLFTRSRPDVRVEVAYGSSGNFYAQIANGAPFDLFLSADVAYARQLDDQGLTRAGSFFRYAQGRVAVWVPASSPLDVEQRGLAVLTDPSVANVAIANPQHAPYGRAAEAALRSAGMFDLVKPRLVLGENVSQALQFVQSGGADAGIVALSLAVAPPVAAGGRYWIIPEDMHPPIDQGGVIVRSTKRAPAAESFRAFLLGEDARQVLQRYGFLTPLG
jgi:molybdate transport system substrate-binding protein